MGQLPAQEGDIHLHIVVLRLRVIAPDLYQHLLFGDHLISIAHQQLYQVVLPAAEPYLTLRAGEGEGGAFQRQIAPGERVALLQLSAAAPQQRADTGQQFLRFKGLGKIVIRAAVQSMDAVAHVAFGGQHQHRRGDAGFPQLLRHLKAVYAGQHHVQHHQIIDAGHGIVQAADAVIAHVSGIALPVQQLAQGVRQPDLILHDQKAHGAAPFYSSARSGATLSWDTR